MDPKIQRAEDEAHMRALIRFTARTLETASPVPFGALILNTRTGEPLVRAVNAVRQENDPSSHAELRTVRKATRKLRRTSLAGHTLYTTCEPCPMCMANALWAGLDRVVFGATIADANRHCRQIRIPAREVARRSDMPCLVTGPILRAECNELFTHPNMQRVFASWRPQTMMTPDDLAALTGCVADPTQILTNPQIVQRLSRDFYWYSPILKPLLDDKRAEAVIQPLSTKEVVDILACCHARHLPVTARGAGTGNYGQAIPLHGGIVLDLSRMDAIHEITADGVAIVSPGTRLGTLEATAREQGWELRCYPSTVVKATVGGFLGGGSGGIGSVAHGGLREPGTIRAIEFVTMEAEPRVLLHEGEAVHEILHAWGTNGILTKVWFALTPAVEWAQCAIAFPTFDEAFNFSEHIATGKAWTKRLITTFEWPIPTCFAAIQEITRPNRALVFLMIAATQLDALISAARDSPGEVTLAAPYTGLNTRPLLSDYTWNHTTLWAIKQDAAFTYLQCGFSATEARQQFAQLKQRFGDELLLHLEFLKSADGPVIPAAIPLVRFTTAARLNEMIDFCRSIGVSVANPHSNNVEGGGRYLTNNLQLIAKQRYDPQNLLNPGKMATFKPLQELKSS